MVEECFLQKEAKRSIGLHYLAYTPKDYDSAKKWPMVVFLHGAGERGTDLNLVARHGFLKYAKQGEEYPFVIVAPQCPFERYWGNYLESLNDFLDEMIKKYNADPERIYLTGLSMGGSGTWLWLMANPDRFAAAAPVCGAGLCWYYDRITDKPLWLFHGEEDHVVETYESVHMYEALVRQGATPKLTLYPGIGHNAWDFAYNRELVDWFMEHRLENWRER